MNLSKLISTFDMEKGDGTSATSKQMMEALEAEVLFFCPATGRRYRATKLRFHKNMNALVVELKEI